ncbi:MAG: sulfotransferase [Bacteroidales bacterium]|nr:sulfotransferase [Bacteroidales bacterium]
MPKRAIRDIPMFFIMGRPRSGTTLLSALFDAHPNVKIPPEFPIFLGLIQRFKKIKYWDDSTIQAFVGHIFENNVFNHRTLENLKIDREALTRELLAAGTEASLADLLKIFNASAYSLFPKQEILMVGDKNPLYSIYIKRFIHTFPDARFVCITRDYRDNFISMKGLADLKLEAPILSLQVLRWRFVAKEFLFYKQRYPERFFIIRYEDVAMKQEETIRNVCHFLGLPFDPSVFDFYTKKEETEKSYPQEIVKRIHSNLMKPINTGRIGLWKKELTPSQIRIADQVAGRYAETMGYERVDPRLHLGTYLKTRSMVIYGTLLFKFMQFGSILPYNVSSWISIKLLILVRTHHYFFGKKSSS